MTTSRPTRYKLLNDEPYLGTEDPLGFDKLAVGLADMILDSASAAPFTLGLRAPWGMGKSTLMLRLKTRLETKRPQAIKTVWFNAWSFEGDDVLAALVKLVLGEIDPGALRSAARMSRVRLLVRSIIPRLVGVANAGAGQIVSDIWDAASKNPGDRIDVRNLLKRALEKQDREELIVVFIDDLDRCRPADVFAVFEAVKLYLNVSGIVFVVGFDADFVSHAVRQERDIPSEADSEAYVEKIIHIDYAIPWPDENAIGRLTDHYAREAGAGDLLTEGVKDLIVKNTKLNPRGVKRFINRFVIEHHLDPDSSRVSEEVLVPSLLIQLYYRSFYVLFRNLDGLNPAEDFLDYADAMDFLRNQSWRNDPKAREVVDRVLENYDLLALDIDDADSGLDQLEQLQDQVHDAFHPLRNQPLFYNMLNVLSVDERDSLAKRLAHATEVESTVTGSESAGLKESRPESSASGATLLGRPLAGRVILWHDDKPENNDSLVHWLQRRGGEVVAAPNTKEAFENARLRKPDLIVTDLSREGDPNAGFAFIEKLTEEGLTPTSGVIIYTARITGHRRRRARELRAEITNDPAELTALFERLLVKTTAPAVGSASGGSSS